MFVFQQCECGGTYFTDIEDKGTYRCEDCGRLAKIKYINEDKEDEKI